MNSEFVATRIIHDLYQLCCEKRFKANAVQKLQKTPRETLYKYLIIPREGQRIRPPQDFASGVVQMQQPRTPNFETQPTTNPLDPRSGILSTDRDQQRPEPKQRTNVPSKSQTEQPGRPRSNTQGFLPDVSQLQTLSTRPSGDNNGGSNDSTTKLRVRHPKQACKDHVNLKDLEHIKRSMKSMYINKDVLCILFC